MAKKDLQLAYSQGNHTAYPPNIETAARYLTTQYPNIKSGNQRKTKQKKEDDQKSEEKDNATTGTAEAHVEDSTTRQDNTAPSGEANLGALVLETNQATSPITRTAEEILGVHPIDDTFWENINPTDMSIDTVNNEEQMAGSHIAKFRTPKDKEITQEDILSEENQHSNHEHQNTRDSTSNPSVADEFVTHEDESILLVAMQDQGHADIMEELATLVGSNRNTVQEFINGMVGENINPTSQSNQPIFEPLEPTLPLNSRCSCCTSSFKLLTLIFRSLISCCPACDPSISSSNIGNHNRSVITLSLWAAVETFVMLTLLLVTFLVWSR